MTDDGSITHDASCTLLARGLRPVARNPPSAGTAATGGWKAAAMIVSGSS